MGGEIVGETWGGPYVSPVERVNNGSRRSIYLNYFPNLRKRYIGSATPPGMSLSS